MKRTCHVYGYAGMAVQLRTAEWMEFGKRDLNHLPQLCLFAGLDLRVRDEEDIEFGIFSQRTTEADQWVMVELGEGPCRPESAETTYDDRAVITGFVSEWARQALMAYDPGRNFDFALCLGRLVGGPGSGGQQWFRAQPSEFEPKMYRLTIET